MPSSVTSLTLLALAGALPFAAVVSAEDKPAAAPLALEAEVIDGKTIPVTPKKELSFSVPADADVRTRELWYRSNDGKAWGAWQKHGIQFDKDTPITWAPPEGHWQVYLRKILTSGLASDVPTEATKAKGEFIIDRTAPTVAVKFPAAKAKLRGGERYAVTWDAQDAHLRGTPVTITWSRDGKGCGKRLPSASPTAAASIGRCPAT
jgi:hypothetical protein